VKDAWDVGLKRSEWPLREGSGSLCDHAGIERGGFSQGKALGRLLLGQLLRGAKCGDAARHSDAKRGRDPAKDQLQNLPALDHESVLAGALSRRNSRKRFRSLSIADNRANVSSYFGLFGPMIVSAANLIRPARPERARSGGRVFMERPRKTGCKQIFYFANIS